MMSRIYKIGRSEKNDIVLTHPSIASFHAEVYVDPQGNCFYTDLSTLSGTKLNGIKMYQPALLSPNDQLVLGEGQELDWEMIFFKRVSIHKQPKKVKIEETTPPLKQQSATPFAAESMTVQPKQGVLYLWPSWLYHGVPEMQSDSTRISFSFNIDFLPLGA